MSWKVAASLFVPLVLGTITVTDPSDVIKPSDWAADNAILADYNVNPIMYLLSPLEAAYTYSGKSLNISRQTLSVDANDTSVIIIANEADVEIDHTTVVKFGYSSDLLQASFFGVNAAINVANASTASLSNVNVTTHNGAANVYAYGTGTVVNVENAWLYSSGPVSHGLYASGNGTINANNVVHYSGGNRCSSFSGDNPAGYINVMNSVAHTDGIGSAICYALGVCNLTNVIGHASNAPVTFSDGPQTTIYKNSDVTAGLLAGTILFSSATREEGASVTFDHSKLTVLGKTMPALWFGNTIASGSIISSMINNTASDILVVANYSQVTQDFDYFAGYADNNMLSPAEATVSVQDSAVSGSIVAYNGSSISLSLSDYSGWTGTAVYGYGDATFGVTLDKTSNWTLTATTKLLNFTNADSTLANIVSNGFNIEYSSSAAANSAWGGKTVSLPGGGSLMPY